MKNNLFSEKRRRNDYDEWDSEQSELDDAYDAWDMDRPEPGEDDPFEGYGND